MAGKVCQFRLSAPMTSGLAVLDGLTRATCAPGQSQFLTTPVLAKPLKFSELTLDDPNYDADLTRGVADSDTRLMEMLAAQAAHSAGPGFDDEDEVAADEKLSDEEKRVALQKALHMAASNGNVEQVHKILNGKAKQYVDVNAPDEDGTPPLIYASCFVSLRIRLCVWPLECNTDRLAGARGGRTVFDKSWCRCGQAGSQPLECSHVGNDQPPQGHSQAAAG